MKQFKKRNILNMIALVFGIVAAVMLIIGILVIVEIKEFVASAAVVEAEVSKIDTEFDSDGDKTHRAYVTYRYENENYKNIRLREYTSSLYEGKKVEIYVDKETPDEARLKSIVYVLPAILIGIGTVFAIIAAMLEAMVYIKKRKQQKLIETGMKIYGEVGDFFVDNTITINGRHPYKLKCNYIDMNSGQPVICTSDEIWEEPDKILGSQVLIYVDRENSGNYYVDLSSIHNNY